MESAAATFAGAGAGVDQYLARCTPRAADFVRTAATNADDRHRVVQLALLLGIRALQLRPAVSASCLAAAARPALRACVVGAKLLRLSTDELEKLVDVPIKRPLAKPSHAWRDGDKTGYGAPIDCCPRSARCAAQALSEPAHH